MLTNNKTILITALIATFALSTTSCQKNTKTTTENTQHKPKPLRYESEIIYNAPQPEDSNKYENLTPIQKVTTGYNENGQMMTRKTISLNSQKTR